MLGAGERVLHGGVRHLKHDGLAALARLSLPEQLSATINHQNGCTSKQSLYFNALRQSL